MNTIRFNSKEAFIDALESRRKFWRDFDKRQERDHKAAEQKWLTDARAKMREAIKWDYATLSRKAGYSLTLTGDSPPRCPVRMEAKIDRVLAALKHTQGKSFVVDTNGVWADAHDLLTSDPDAKRTVC